MATEIGLYNTTSTIHKGIIPYKLHKVENCSIFALVYTF